MYRTVHFVISLVCFVFVCTSCSQPKLLLKPKATIDTLHLELDLKLVQQYEYRQALIKKMTKFVEVYNSEQHPFKLSLNSGSTTTSCQLKVVRVKFIGTKENIIGTAISIAGLSTATILTATGFAVPFGWVYIPSARTSLQPTLSSDISEGVNFQRVGISSIGMYRPLSKQIDKQSTKFVKYIVTMVQGLEAEYVKTR